MNSPNSPDTPIDSDLSETGESRKSMEEYYLLKKSILVLAVSMTGIIFPVVWISLSFDTAVSYLLGATVGIIYLRMLAKDVEKINTNETRGASGRLAIFAGVIVLAARVDKFSILPVFLGFLTYKVAIVFYVLFTSVVPMFSQKANNSQ
ncbi:ATP synthase subunit I [[Limnothrix rosea] IAM M-220]|uniref:ATP synthase subunit I n=1 Tax=[Limnothrix rosea] IAM M-220 TaxID=454133 RepID=UPI001CECDC18|nr:ATP synthase subunit I [[Limnothrix rosea] IAM M-220]